MDSPEVGAPQNTSKRVFFFEDGKLLSQCEVLSSMVVIGFAQRLSEPDESPNE